MNNISIRRDFYRPPNLNTQICAFRYAYKELYSNSKINMAILVGTFLTLSNQEVKEFYWNIREDSYQIHGSKKLGQTLQNECARLYCVFNDCIDFPRNDEENI